MQAADFILAPFQLQITLTYRAIPLHNLGRVVARVATHPNVPESGSRQLHSKLAEG